MSKNKTPLRSDFTDALDEEIANRKILERANLKETPAPVEKAAEVVETVDVVEISAPAEPVEPPAEPVEVKAETKLEERILREADNTFFDEKPVRRVTATKADSKSPPRSIYHSKALRQWEEEHQGEALPPTPPVAQERKMSRAERAGVIIAAVMIVYAFVMLDKPLFFLAMSLLVHFLGPTIGAFAGKKYGAAVQNAMHSCSIVLFFGAIFFLFV